MIVVAHLVNIKALTYSLIREIHHPDATVVLPPETSVICFIQMSGYNKVLDLIANKVA